MCRQRSCIRRYVDTYLEPEAHARAIRHLPIGQLPAPRTPVPLGGPLSSSPLAATGGGQLEQSPGARTR